MSLKTRPSYQFEDYLATERAQTQVKHEYVDGAVFAMTGASFNHNLKEYVLVNRDRPLVEVYTRQPDGRWLLDAMEGMDGEVRFESIACAVAMREIYDKVDFEAE